MGLAEHGAIMNGLEEFDDDDEFDDKFDEDDDEFEDEFDEFEDEFKDEFEKLGKFEFTGGKAGKSLRYSISDFRWTSPSCFRL